MIQIGEQDRDFLKQSIENADALLSGSDVNAVLEALYMAIERKGFDKDDNYNDFGRAAQKVYDRIYLSNA